MPAVDWAAILSGTGASVVYSSMSNPDDRGSDGVVAEISLPGEHFIDISWFRKEGRYHVRLYREFIENIVGSESICASPQSAIDFAKDLALSVMYQAVEIPEVTIHGNAEAAKIKIERTAST